MTGRFFRARPLSPEIVSVFVLLACMASIVHGEPIQIVVPNAYTITEAAGLASGAERIRAQYIYAADQFADLPAGGGYLTSFRWRPDGDTALPGGWSYDELTIIASVTDQAPDTMSWTFADNATGPMTVVRATASWQGSTQNVGPLGGPKAFDIVWDLDTPFRYNPAEGNLLLDMVGQGETPIFHIDRLDDFDTVTAAVIVAWNWDPVFGLPAAAQAYVGAMVMEVDFVIPQPLDADFNGNGHVDGLDLAAWSEHFGLSAASKSQGDADSDGDVDGADFLAWQRHLGSGLPAVGPSAAVPEPATRVMLLVAAAGYRLRGRRSAWELSATQ